MIRYVCLSDLHAGAPAGLFRQREGLPDIGPLLARALGALLDGPGPPPTLILLGDAMDLQFSPRAAAAEAARGILSALRAHADWAPEVIATAGNHDHALWTDARLGLDLAALADGAARGAGATPAFAPAPAARPRLLDAVARGAGFASVDFRYPNIGLRRGDRAVLLHHGHFHEAAYRVVTRLRGLLAEGPRPAPTAESLSAENGGWIDFAWASLGDAAGLGAQGEDLYQRLLTPTGYRAALRQWAGLVAEAAADRVPMAALPHVRAVVEAGARTALGLTLGRMREDERHHEVDPLPHGAREGLAWYLSGPAAAQMRAELDAPPAALTYVCGHTHKAYADRAAPRGRAGPVDVLNTGGWTLNGPRLDNAEGAAVALIDGDMNAVLLRAFATPGNGRMAPARVEGFGAGDGGALRAHAKRRLSASRGDWEALSEAARAHYAAIQDDLLERTEA